MEPFASLVSTKFARPQTAAGTLLRSRLDLCADDVQATRLAIVRAPAGFGKTTLLRRWWEQLAASGHDCTWLTLDRYDNDPQRLATYLGAALHAAPLRTDREAFRAGVAASLGAAVDRTALFLDDAENLVAEEALDVLRTLVELTGPKLVLVLATRAHHRLGQARLRANAALLEIGADDLRYAPNETYAVLERRLGTTLDDAAITHLHRRTDGWPAGIQLASLSLADRHDANARVRTFCGTDDQLAEYFAEDLLARLPDDLRTFILCTAHLERLNGPLCDAVTGRTDGDRTLAHLEATGLFLRRIETQRNPAWYRYHSLFAEYLRGQRGRLGERRVVEIHRAACAWFHAHGDTFEAAEHALSAGDPQAAAALIEPTAMSYIERGQLNTVIAWAERLPVSALERSHTLSLAYLWAISFVRHSETPGAMLERLERFEHRAAGTATHLDDHLAILKAVNFSFADDWQAMRRIAFDAWSRPMDERSWEFGVLANVVAHCHCMSGEFASARAALARGRPSLEGSGRSFSLAYAAMLDGMSYFAELHVETATAHLRDCLPTEPTSRDATHPEAVAGALLAEALYERNQLEEARVVLERNLSLVAEAGIPDLVIIAHLTLARIAFLRGDDAAAHTLLEQGQRIGFRRCTPRLVESFRYEVKRFLLLTGNAAEAIGYMGPRPLGLAENGAIMPVAEQMIRDIAPARLALLDGNADGLADRLGHFAARARDCNLPRRALTLGVLEAIALDGEGHRGKAVERMAGVLRAGLTRGFVRTFLDEGPHALQLARAAAPALERSVRRDERRRLAERLDALLLAASNDRFANAETPENRGRAGPDALTAREVELISCLAEGLSNRDLGARLALSETTVKWHLRNIYGKLGVANRTEAVFHARRAELIS